MPALQLGHDARHGGRRARPGLLDARLLGRGLGLPSAPERVPARCGPRAPLIAGRRLPQRLEGGTDVGDHAGIDREIVGQPRRRGLDLQHLAARRERRARGVPDLLEERPADHQHRGRSPANCLAHPAAHRRRACRDRRDGPSERNCARAGPRTTPRRRCARPASPGSCPAPARATSSPATIVGFFGGDDQARHRRDARRIGPAGAEDHARACPAGTLVSCSMTLMGSATNTGPAGASLAILKARCRIGPSSSALSTCTLHLVTRRRHRREVVAEHGIAQPHARVLLARRHHHAASCS